MTTLRSLAEQVLLRLSGFAPSADLEVTYDDIYPTLIQTINGILKTEFIQLKMKLADDHPQEAALATFTDLEVIPYEEGLVIGCEYLRFDLNPSEWAEADGDIWVDPDGDSWVVSGAVNVRLTTSSTGEGLYHFVVDQISFPSGITAADVVAFLTEASTASYIEFVVLENDLPVRFARAAMSNIVEISGGIEFDYDTLDIQLAPSEIISLVRASARLLKSFVTKDGLSMTAISRCGPSYGNTSQRAAVLLPVQPLSLPYGQGVWRVFDPYLPDEPWIPIGNAYYGMTNGVDHTGLATFLEGKNTYTWFGGDRIVFNIERALMPDRMAVQLVVVSADKVGEFDPLPVPADFESDVVDKTFETILKVKMPDYQVSSTTEQ